MTQHHTIGIVGRDFCGSTMLLRLLTCLDGVKSGGELHWLVDVPPSGVVRTRAGWDVSRRCVVHGDDCKAFTREFTSARHAQKDLYAEAAEALGAQVLVSADKMISHYQRFVKRWEMDAIVLFKTPQAQVYSDMKNERRGFFDALDMWTTTYDAIIKWALGEKFPKRTVFVSYEQLAADPLMTLEVICRALDLPKPPEDLLQRFSDAPLVGGYHCIGCSPHSHKRDVISVDKDWKPHLKDGELRLCELGPASKVLDRLYHLSVKP
jgi:hypothetical protein